MSRMHAIRQPVEKLTTARVNSMFMQVRIVMQVMPAHLRVLL